MARKWIPIQADFNITSKDADELVKSLNPEEWMKAYIRKKYNLPQDTEIDLSQLNVERVAQQEPIEDTVLLVKCPYCRAHHQKYMVDLCPMNPYKVR